MQHDLLQQGLSYKIEDVCRFAASMPAPRFYVSPAVALNKYRHYLNGHCSIRYTSKRKMFAEIFMRYERLVNIAIASRQRIRKTELMERVLSQQAPSFYYEDKSMPAIYYYGLKQRKKRRL